MHKVVWPLWLGFILLLPVPAEAQLGNKRDRLIDEQLQAIDGAARAVIRKHEDQKNDLRRTYQRAYKALHGGQASLWVRPHARKSLSRRRAMIKKMLRQKLREVALLGDEAKRLARSRDRVVGSRTALSFGRLKISLDRPVPGGVIQRYGRYRDRRTHASLTRRGLGLWCRRGQTVKTVGPGKVIFTGVLRGLNEVVMVDHGEFYSILGRLAGVTVIRGQTLVRGQVLGVSQGKSVYLEVRLPGSSGGIPIDPSMLFRQP